MTEMARSSPRESQSLDAHHSRIPTLATRQIGGGLMPERSTENVFSGFSGTRWNMQGQDPVIVHDILSTDILDIRDHKSLQIKAMIHGRKDEGGLLDRTCELCLEDGAGVDGLEAKLQKYTKEWKARGALPSDDVETGGATEKPTDEGKEINDPEGTKSHSAPPGKE
ncbi:hypothetical protein lerEdw1_000848 [Lerista edwardsae]|nr:hypothetical protein lerEdw1_000848 [Lerista edwardsae]